MRCDLERESSKWLIIIWPVVIYDRQYKSPIKAIQCAFVYSRVCGSSSPQQITELIMYESSCGIRFQLV